MADPITVACPMPDCGWTSSVFIGDDYPASVIDMLTNSAGLVREHHISQHGALAWFEAWEKAAGQAKLWEEAADRNGRLYSGAENQRDDLREQLANQLPRRGDHVEAWLKAQRDACFGHASTYNAVDGLLDEYRLHADTGTPLDQHCCEGGNVDDCAGCYDAKEE